MAQTSRVTARDSRLIQAERAAARMQRTAASIELSGQRLPATMRMELEAVLARLSRAQLIDKYGHRQGTPETYAAIDAIPANRRQSPIDRMYEGGQISIEQQNAANEIASVAEAIERGVDVRGANYEPRIDNPAAGRDALLESLGRIRLEVAYSTWRNRLPMPRRMVVDMVLTNRSLVATARVYNIPWRKARERLLDALDLWIDLKEQTWATIDEDDVTAVYSKLGCGVLMPPRPRASQHHDA